MAAVGHTPIAEIQFADYIMPAFDQVTHSLTQLTHSLTQLTHSLTTSEHSTNDYYLLLCTLSDVMRMCMYVYV